MLWLTKEFINLSNQLYKYILEKDISSLKVQINKNPKLIKKIDKVIRNDKTRDKFFNKINHGFFKRSPFLFACYQATGDFNQKKDIEIFKIVEFLVKQGSDLSFFDRNDLSVIDIAYDYRTPNLLDILIDNPIFFSNYDPKRIKLIFHNVIIKVFKNSINEIKDKDFDDRIDILTEITGIDFNNSILTYLNKNFNEFKKYIKIIKQGNNYGYFLNKSDLSGKNVLHLAIINKKFEYAKLLITETNINIYLRDKDGKISFDYLSEQSENTELFDFFYKKMKDNKAYTKKFLLFYIKTKNIERIKEILKNTSENYDILLFEAIKTENISLLEAFILSGYNVNILNENNESLLNYGIKLNKEVVKHLIFWGINYQKEVIDSIEDKDFKVYVENLFSRKKGFDIFWNSEIKKKVFDIEILDDWIKEFEYINIYINAFNILYLISGYGYRKVVEYLLNNNADINTKVNTGHTALHFASQHGHIEVVKYLLDNNADVNAKTNEGWTSLHLASQNGHIEVVKYLLDNNADINAKTNEGATSLHIASQNGHIKVVECLLDNNADVNTKVNTGHTALHLASKNGHIKMVECLLDNNADVNTKVNTGHTALHVASQDGHIKVVECLLDNKSDISLKTNKGFTALHIASQNGHIKVVKCLLDNKSDISLKTNNGSTALYLASQEGHIEVVKYLLDKSADINAKENKGRTALHHASQEGHIEVVKCLLDNNADINAKMNEGWTALHIALYLSKEEIAIFLLKNGAKLIPFPSSNETIHIYAKNRNLNKVLEYLNYNSFKK